MLCHGLDLAGSVVHVGAFHGERSQRVFKHGPLGLFVISTEKKEGLIGHEMDSCVSTSKDREQETFRNWPNCSS